MDDGSGHAGHHGSAPLPRRRSRSEEREESRAESWESEEFQGETDLTVPKCKKNVIQRSSKNVLNCLKPGKCVGIQLDSTGLNSDSCIKKYEK